MKSKLSALFDGEVDSREADAMLAALRDHADAQHSFHLYGAIGEALRNDPSPVADITDRVMAAIRLEPELSMVRRIHREWRRPLLAAMASLAGVAIVAAVALLPQEREPTPAALASAAPQVVPAAVDAGLAANDIQEYLIAHQTHNAQGYFGSSQQQVRTVSLVEQRGTR